MRLTLEYRILQITVKSQLDEEKKDNYSETRKLTF